MGKHLVVAAAGILALIYLLNPTAGVLEVIPDFVPIVGHLDEAAAAALLLACLKYFGWDLTRLFHRSPPGPSPKEPEPPEVHPTPPTVPPAGDGPQRE